MAVADRPGDGCGGVERRPGPRLEPEPGREPDELVGADGGGQGGMGMRQRQLPGGFVGEIGGQRLDLGSGPAGPSLEDDLAVTVHAGAVVDVVVDEIGPGWHRRARQHLGRVELGGFGWLEPGAADDPGGPPPRLGRPVELNHGDDGGIAVSVLCGVGSARRVVCRGLGAQPRRNCGPHTLAQLAVASTAPRPRSIISVQATFQAPSLETSWPMTSFVTTSSSTTSPVSMSYTMASSTWQSVICTEPSGCSSADRISWRLSTSAGSLTASPVGLSLLAGFGSRRPVAHR